MQSKLVVYGYTQATTVTELKQVYAPSTALQKAKILADQTGNNQQYAIVGKSDFMSFYFGLTLAQEVSNLQFYGSTPVSNSAITHDYGYVAMFTPRTPMSYEYTLDFYTAGYLDIFAFEIITPDVVGHGGSTGRTAELEIKVIMNSQFEVRRYNASLNNPMVINYYDYVTQKPDAKMIESTTYIPVYSTENNYNLITEAEIEYKLINTNNNINDANYNIANDYYDFISKAQVKWDILNYTQINADAIIGKALEYTEAIPFIGTLAKIVNKVKYFTDLYNSLTPDLIPIVDRTVEYNYGDYSHQVSETDAKYLSRDTVITTSIPQNVTSARMPRDHGITAIFTLDSQGSIVAPSPSLYLYPSDSLFKINLKIKVNNVIFELSTSKLYENVLGYYTAAQTYNINSISSSTRYLRTVTYDPNTMLSSSRDYMMIHNTTNQLKIVKIYTSKFTNYIDTYLNVYNYATGKKITSNDNGHSYGQAYVEFIIPAYGMYMIESRTANLLQTGRYYLNVSYTTFHSPFQPIQPIFEF